MYLFYCIIILSVLSDILFGQQLPNYSIDEVKITAHRTASVYNETVRGVVVIDKSQIAALPVQSVQDLLEYVAGLDIQTRGPMGVQGDISLRGSTFEQVQVLINGIKLNDPQTGHHNLNIPIQPQDIERIEILKGGAARTFGQNAFAGSINIITRIPEKREYSATLLAGDYGYYEGAFSISDDEPVSGSPFISFSQRGANGYKRNTDFSITNFFYQGKFGKRGQSKIMGGYNGRHFGANGFYSARFPTQWEKTETFFAGYNGDYNLSKSWKLVSRLYWRQHYDNFLLKREDPSFYNNKHRSNVLGAEIGVSYFSKKCGTISFGAELRREMLKSNNLGIRERDFVGFYAEQFFQSGRFTITPGLYANYFSDYDWQFFPGLDIGIKISQNIRGYASVGRSFRIPSYTDLYYRDPVNIGNPNLKPDQAWNYEVGLRLNAKGVIVEGAGFRRQGINLIDWLRQPIDSLNSNTTWRAENIGSIITQGTEVTLVLLPTIWAGIGNFFLNKLQFSYAYLDQERVKGEQRYAQTFLRHQLILSGMFRITSKLQWSLIAKHEVRRITGEVFLLDSKIQWNEKYFSVFLEGTNLLERVYTDGTGLLMPSRWIRGGVCIRI